VPGAYAGGEGPEKIAHPVRDFVHEARRGCVVILLVKIAGDNLGYSSTNIQSVGIFQYKIFSSKDTPLQKVFSQ
jgi:hypothetical protein